MDPSQDVPGYPFFGLSADEGTSREVAREVTEAQWGSEPSPN